jgi:hypothetical protein
MHMRRDLQRSAPPLNCGVMWPDFERAQVALNPAPSLAAEKSFSFTRRFDCERFLLRRNRRAPLMAKRHDADA